MHPVSSSARSLLVIPGVGDQRPGEVLDNLQVSGVDGTRGTETVEGREVHFIEAPSNVPYQRIYELNWSDLSPPSRHLLDLPRYFLSLVFVLMRCGSRPPQALGGPVWLPRLYQFWFDTVFVWTMQIPILLLIRDLFLQGNPMAFLPAGLHVILVLRFLQVVRTSRLLAVGATVWFGVFGAMIVLADRFWLMPLATIVYVVGLVGTVVLATSASIEVILNRRAARVRNGRIAWLGMLHIPFATVSGVYGLLMGVIAATSGNPDIFIGSVVDNELLDAAFGEIVMVFYSATVFVLGLGVYLVYWIKRRSAAAPNQLFQNGVALILLVSSTVLLTGGLLFGLEALHVIPQLVSPDDKADRSAILASVYQVSAFRFVAILPFLFLNPFRNALDRVGDVLFYNLRENDPSSTRNMILTRLNALQRHLDARGEAFDVLAHSQGSVIARDGIDFTGRHVVTLGSPIDSLYARFLGLVYHTPLGANFRWTNRFRTDDVLAGPVAEATDDAILRDGSSGHGHYFRSPEVFALIQRRCVPAA